MLRPRMLCTTLPLDVQGGIKGGLESTVRFGNNSTPHLDSDFRRNDEVTQSPLGHQGGGLCKSTQLRPCNTIRTANFETRQV